MRYLCNCSVFPFLLLLLLSSCTSNTNITPDSSLETIDVDELVLEANQTTRMTLQEVHLTSLSFISNLALHQDASNHKYQSDSTSDQILEFVRELGKEVEFEKENRPGGYYRLNGISGVLLVHRGIHQKYFRFKSHLLVTCSLEEEQVKKLFQKAIQNPSVTGVL